MKNIITIILLFVTVTSRAQQPFVLGLPHTLEGYGRFCNDALVQWSNPACLPSSNERSFTLRVRNRFGLKEMKDFGAAVGVQHGSGRFTLGFSGSILAGVSMGEAGIGYGRSLGNICIGMGILFKYISIPGYGSAAMVLPTLGIQAQCSPTLSVGCLLYNPVRQHFKGQETELVPAFVGLGFAGRLSKQFTLYGEIRKEEGFRTMFQCELSYQAATMLCLQGGVSSLTNACFFSALLKYKQVLFDFTTEFHPYLGFSPSFGISLNKPHYESTNSTGTAVY